MLANPFDERTFKDFCDQYGFTLMTLWRYRKTFQDELTNEVESRRKKFVSDLRSTAYKSLAQRLKHDTQALRLFFQVSGDLVERSEVKAEYLTAEDKRAKIARMLEDLAKKGKNEDEQQDQ